MTTKNKTISCTHRWSIDGYCRSGGLAVNVIYNAIKYLNIKRHRAPLYEYIHRQSQTFHQKYDITDTNIVLYMFIITNLPNGKSKIIRVRKKRSIVKRCRKFQVEKFDRKIFDIVKLSGIARERAIRE